MKYREALKQKSKKLTLVTFMGEEEGVKIKSVFHAYVALYGYMVYFLQMIDKCREIAMPVLVADEFKGFCGRKEGLIYFFFDIVSKEY